MEESWNQPRVAEPVDSNWRTGAGMLHWDCCPKIEMLAGGRGAVRDIPDRRQTGRVSRSDLWERTGTCYKYLSFGCLPHRWGRQCGAIALLLRCRQEKLVL